MKTDRCRRCRDRLPLDELIYRGVGWLLCEDCDDLVEVVTNYRGDVLRVVAPPLPGGGRR